MSKTVLHVENRGEVSYYLREYLEKEGYDVINAMDAEDASYCWEEDKEKIDFLIVDLNLPRGNQTRDNHPPENSLLQQKSDIFIGWYWLEGVFQESPGFIQKTIIYSGFIDELRELLKEELDGKYRGITLVDKRNTTRKHPFQLIQQALDKIENNA